MKNYRNWVLYFISYASIFLLIFGIIGVMGISVHTPRISDNEIYSEQKESSHSETNVDSLASIEPQAPDISHDGLFKSVPQICNEHRVRGDSTVRSLSSTWPMFKNTPERIGDSNSNIPESTPVKTLWESQAESSYSSPVVAYSKVYLSTSNGYVYCFEETTGKLRWKAQVTAKENAAVSTPAVNAGKLIVFSSGDGTVYRLNAYSGEIDWKFVLPGQKTTLNISHVDHPILIYNGNVLFGAPNRYFYCLNETTGNLVWSFKTQEGLTYDYGIIGGATAIDDIVYFGANDGWLYAMDLTGFSDGNQGWLFENVSLTGPMDGDVLWKSPMGDSICSTPVVFNNYIYITIGNFESFSGNYKIFKMFCLYRSNGSVKWEYRTNDHIVSSPSVSGNRIFFGSLDRKIYCLATDTNTTQWQPVSTGGPIWSSPAVSGGKLVIGSKDSFLYCIRTNNGNQVWKLALDSPISSSPALANNRIFINSQQGKLYCIGPADTKAPNIINSTPWEGQVNVPVSGYLMVKFDKAINPDTIKSENVIVQNSVKVTTPIDVNYDDETLTLTIKPKNYFNRSEKYSVRISANITDCAGNKLDSNKDFIQQGSPTDDYTWSFTTSSNNPPTLTEAKVSPVVGYLGTEFTFSVLYADEDNDPPGNQQQNILIYLDNEPAQKMHLNDTPGAPLRYKDKNYVDSEQFVFKTKLKYLGIHNFRIWCHDGIDWNETEIEEAPILPGPPEIESIPDQYLKEDEKLTLNLTHYISDPDTPIDGLIFQANSNYVIVNGSLISFIYTNSFNYPSNKKSELVNISVTDGIYYSSSEIMVWVESINDPPIINSIPTQIVVENQEIRLNLTKYIIDIDNKFNELNITEDSDNTFIDGLELVFNYPTGIEEDKILLNVSDGEFIVQQEINITIVSSDVSFVFRTIPDLKVIEDIEYEFDILEYIIIIKGSVDNLVLSCSSTFSTIETFNIKFLYNDSFLYPTWRTIEEVNITITDNTINFKQSVTIKVNVVLINDSPKLFNGTVEPGYGNISATYKFSVFYYDKDGSQNIKVQLVIDDKKYTLSRESGTKNQYPGALYSYSTLMDIGYHYYYFTCDDNSGEPNSKFSSEIGKVFVTGNLDPLYSKNNGLIPGVIDPDSADFDSDGITNAWEMLYGFDPTNHSDAIEDSDGDNYNNLLEFLGPDGIPTGNDSTDPLNASDRPFSDQETTSKRDEEVMIPHWQATIIGVIVIVVLIILIYYVISTRELGKLVQARKGMKVGVGKDSEETDFTDDISEKDEDTTDEDIIDDDLIDLEEDEEFDTLAIPITEVDLTSDEKPFFEPEDMIDETSENENEEETNAEFEMNKEVIEEDISDSDIEPAIENDKDNDKDKVYDKYLDKEMDDEAGSDSDAIVNKKDSKKRSKSKSKKTLNNQKRQNTKGAQKTNKNSKGKMGQSKKKT